MRDHEDHEGDQAHGDHEGHGRSSGGNRAGTRDWGRGTETPEERADRRWGDLLQELRVAQTGVQILFGFLLTVVFQQRFTALSDTDRHIYTVTVILGAATVGVLVGPVSLHRILTGRRLKPETVLLASRLTILGLLLLLCTMTSSLLLVLRLAVEDSWATGLVGVMALWFVICCFAVPLWARHRGNPTDD